MEIAEVRQLIEAGIPGCEVTVYGEGCSFSAVVVAEVFAGMSPVKRQQRVLATITQPLSTGALHAISMKVYTPSEWALERNREAVGR
jgi:acid stress-induced BolA-like protein IbaG/YrbA